ncbi:hypothetical protein [Nannocystis sp. SCPEA4]|uniref:hypothetical protein n=1 Tax=Nannocystis sp. SCPEA4 TaxID=2996787 RepID=UPI00226DB584|nr:hypothetical protein [Nannocystis sp. SCPEA4]MCY1056638.1 hypothetical protein [Nannocystis sp. SCPEA4]
METPVIYFYAGRPTEVRLSVRFERGGLTEWFPHAQEVDHGHIDWGRFTVEPASASNLARMPEASARGHYFAARDTDAAVVRVPTPAGEQHEKFLFYRGVGVFDLPLVVGLAGADVSLRRRTDAGPRTALVVERRGARLGLAEVALADGAVTVPRPTLDDDVAAARAWLAAALERDGLYPREASAMLATWEDQWFEDGLRVFYLLPRRDIDELLPLAIEPIPVELRRTIVARAELVTPELEAAVRAEALAPGRDVEAVCRALRARHGRFAEAVLQRLRADADARTAARLDAVLARVAEPRPCPEV